MACSKSSRQTEATNALDLDIVIDNVLEHLPIRIAAQTSVLSKQWRRCWLSLKSLVFDEDFWKEQRVSNTSPKLKWSKIITSILLYHNGRVHNFDLYIPRDDAAGDYMNHSHWLYILSKKDVKQIAIDNWDDRFNIASYIFCCTELVHLVLDNFILNPPPTGFSGYRNLKHLELINITFTRENTFLSLVENCSMLAYLKLEKCRGVDHIVIDFPNLKNVIIEGVKSIAFRDVCSLESLSMSLSPEEIIPDNWTFELIDVENLASSCKLQSIQFNGQLCEFLVVGGIPRHLPVTFNYLNKLCLSELDFGGYGVFLCVLGIIESCPCIKMLDISFQLESYADERPDLEGTELDYNFSRKLSTLLEVQFKGIKGSSAELKLIEYLFAISPVLEKLSFMPRPSLDINLKMEVLQVLMEFPRASPKARLVCLKS